MIPSEELLVLMRLVLAHLFTDFVLQPASWVRHRKEKKLRSGKLYLHALLTASVAYGFSGVFTAWWIFAGVFITHFVIDLWKAYQPDKARYFLIDQLLHFAVIAVLWLFTFNRWDEFGQLITGVVQDIKLVSVICGYIVVAWPLGILIGIATEKWRNEANVNSEGLAKAGMWIGLLERFLILTFILIDQFTAVGLLIAAKSVLRFSDKENTQKKTEYVLIGTLMSFSASFGIGLLLKFFVQ